MKKLLIILMILFLAGCTPTPTSKEKTKYSKTTIDAGFDTAITLLGYCTSQEEFDTYFQIMSDNFIYYNKLFDKYNTYYDINNIKTINDYAGKKAIEVDDAIIEMLLLSKEYYDLTDGAFDVTMGSVLAIWHEYREKGMSENQDGNKNPAVPTEEELFEAYDKYEEYGWDYIEIDQEKKTVFITSPFVQLDVGGVAKGFATEKVAKILEKEGLTQGAINGGGNVRLIGSKPDGSKWGIGITNPDNSGGNIATFYDLDPHSYVTSGDYQRYYESNGKKYSHIISPYTLFPADYFTSVTIVCDDSGIADCLSTALFIVDIEQGKNIIKAYNYEHEDKIGAVWVSLEKPESTSAIKIGDYYVDASENLFSVLNIYGGSK